MSDGDLALYRRLLPVTVDPRRKEVLRRLIIDIQQRLTTAESG